MTEILITSSVLILALLVLRKLFRNTLSRRVQYALWGLVLVRLLVPVSLPAVDFSILTAAKPVEQTVTRRIVDRPVYVPVARAPLTEHPTAPDLSPERAEISEGESVWLVETDETAVQYKRLSAETVLCAVWLTGSGIAAVFLLAVNLRFWLRLRRSRELYPVEGCTLPVYLVETELSSPCLFGLFRPAVYVTPAALSSPEHLRHVLAHETTHARHLDHFWTLLRGICLAVYWFDPLVWIASSAAKTDCELACDEGTLARLGEEERIPYGQTLLSLIPVRRAGNPMLAATTMAAGKKQLKDRFTRIAKKPRQLVSAFVAAVLLAGVISACTFTGAKMPEVTLPDAGTPPEDAVLQALSGEELRFFNEEFFNGDPVYNEAGYSYVPYNLLNQFASPWFPYDKPENIDLYELFYCDGSTELSGEEVKAAFGFVRGVDDLPCPAFRLTTAEIDSILTRYTGLTLEQTNKVGLENFDYLPEYDAYYWMHGDTNYCGELSLLLGTRESSTVRLYQGSGDGWTCVTLEEQEDGGYWFVSNQACEKPAIPTPMPAGEPEAVIPLDSLKPYKAPAVAVESRTGDFDGSYKNRLANWDIDGHNIIIYRDRNGVINAAIQTDEVRNVFLTGLDDHAQLFFFNDLFGHDGFTITYTEWEGWEDRSSYSNDADLNYGTFVDYYYFTEDGSLALLFRDLPSGGTLTRVDMDGDGSDELLSEKELIFQRDGKLYRADLYQMVQDACAQLEFWGYSTLDPYAKCLRIEGYYSETGYDWQTAVRYLYFDGEQLLLFKGEQP